MQAEAAPRPRRAAAGAALDKMRAIREWEGAPESSELFRTVAAQVEAEFDCEELSSEERMAVEAREAAAEAPDDTVELVAAESDDEDEPDDGEDSDGYESSFIDDEDCSDGCSSDEEWTVCKRVCAPGEQKPEGEADEEDDMDTEEEEEDDEDEDEDAEAEEDEEEAFLLDKADEVSWDSSALPALEPLPDVFPEGMDVGNACVEDVCDDNGPVS